jgi:hypothetical protein
VSEESIVLDTALIPASRPIEGRGSKETVPAAPHYTTVLNDHCDPLPNFDSGPRRAECYVESLFVRRRVVIGTGRGVRHSSALSEVLKAT